MYVNDFALISHSQTRLDWLKSQLIQEFNIKDLGKAKSIIEWEIARNLQTETSKID